jgi:hypothetical protein
MKPKEKKPEEVFRIINRATGKPEGVYSRAYCDEYDFYSADSARSSNCHDIYKDRAKYGIAKYRVTYELIEEDCDPPTPEEVEVHEAGIARDKEMDAKGITDPMERAFYGTIFNPQSET